MAQLKEMKRLADLKDKKEKFKKSLKKILNPATIRAQTQKMAEHEAKRKKMFNEYNHQITHRADQLLITKISYKINSSREPTIRITIANDPLNVTVHERFRLKTLGFNKKRKRSEILTQVFVKENIVVDGIKRNQAPPPGVEGRKGLVIKEPKEGIFYYNRNFDLVFQRVSELHLATIEQLIRIQGSIIRDTLEAEEVYNLMELEIESMDDVTKAREIAMKFKLSAKYQLAVKGHSECKASERNIRCIQVKDIIKEVEDHLKTYSSDGMDITCELSKDDFQLAINELTKDDFDI
ncbi:hypothetical protein Tco_1546711 [Tanacetum coccineum]